MTDHRRAPEVRLLPAFFTGTSAEYIGDRPLPRAVRERAVVFVLGPAGVGKSVVAARIADDPIHVLDTPTVQQAIIARVRTGAWTPELVEANGLVLDGPVWLNNRPGVVDLLSELLRIRADAGRRTVVCQADTDASVHLLLERFEAGRCATIALRFPSSRRARLRAAERLCVQLGVPVRHARGTASTPDWSYRAVIHRIRGPIFTIE